MSDPIITRSVSSELYRKVTIDCDHVDSYHHETVYEEVEPDLYVYRQGGLFEAFYRCDKEEADGAVFIFTGEDNDE